MKQTIIIIFLAVMVMALYKHQHIQPIHDPKDSPLFSETLRRSLDKFKKDGMDAGKRFEDQAKIDGGKQFEAQAKTEVENRYADRHGKRHVGKEPLSRYGKKTPHKHEKRFSDIEITGAPQKGRSDAPITILVFTDFKCIHCSDWANTLDDIVREFPNAVRLVFKNFPLPFSEHSELAAKAVLAAKEQGKFWEMHDLLFKNREALERKNLITYAQMLGINRTEFQESLEKKELTDILEKDKIEAKRLGVMGAPTSFINGIRLTGSKPVPYVRTMIKEMLTKANK